MPPLIIHDFMMLINLITVVQDGGCEYGDVGWTVQQNKTCGVRAQFEVLPVWLYRRLLYSTLSITETNAVHVEQITALWSYWMLQHEITSTIFRCQLLTKSSVYKSVDQNIPIGCLTSVDPCYSYRTIVI